MYMFKKLFKGSEGEVHDGNRRIGDMGESLAVTFLKKNGYEIVEQNYRSALGEIDVIARDGGVLVFVEVKARRTDRYGGPKWAVTPQKKRKISMLALEYLKKTGQMDTDARFDVVAIRLFPNQAGVEIIKNAFELAY